MVKLSKMCRVVGILALAGVMVFAVGCTKKGGSTKEEIVDEKDVTMHVGSDKSLTVTYKDEFDESYYSQEELKTKAEEELKAFGESISNPNAAKLEAVTMEDQTVWLSMKFQDADTYVQYVKACEDKESTKEVFVGTIAQAGSKGIELDVAFTKFGAGEEEEKVMFSDIDNRDELMVMTVNSKQTITVDGDIKYYTEANENRNGVDTTGEKTAVILYIPKDVQ